ncbi:MAG TPA: protein translocase subunit SecD, partial [Gammaproteobacteria bacterium]|nr:protein translocase subunit SecD [Gammaproteobacteria bacterium]
MLNRYPAWKNIVVVLVTALGILFALPNLYGEDPALQVSENGATVTEATVTQVKQALDTAKLPYRDAEIDKKQVLVRFDGTDTQLRALDAVKQALGDKYTVALNLAPRTPEWMQAIGLKPMSKGLDLQGGVHFQLRVDLDAAVQTTLQRNVNDLRGAFREKLIRYEDLSLAGSNVNMTFRSADDVSKARQLLAAQYPQFTVSSGSAANTLVAVMTPAEVQRIRSSAVDQNITTLRNRVNELGVAEPVVQQQGINSIVVELPGVQDTTRAKNILGGTATLEFRLVDYTSSAIQAQQSGHVPLEDQLFKDRQGNPVLLKRDVIASGANLVDAVSGFDQETG